MAKKPSITTIASGYQSTATLNNNFTNVRDAFDNTLSLDGSTPNAMQADLDMNSYDILNANSITTDTLTVDGVDITVVNEVKLNIADITTVANNITDVYLVADNIYGINNVSAAITNCDLINDVYQGAHDTNPTVRLDGSALQNGDIYWNTSLNLMRTYSNGSWYNTGAGGSTDGSLVSYTASGTGAVARTLESKERDCIAVLDFMSDTKRADVLARTGLYDNSTEIVAACNAGIAQGKAVYFPGGQYNFGSASTLRATALIFNLAAGQSLHVFGDGPGNTVIKEAAGQNAVIGRFDYIWLVRANNGAAARSVIFRNLTIDKNGASNGAPPTSAAWEQSHCLSIGASYTDASNTGSLQHVHIENVETLDKVGSGVILSGGAIYRAFISHCHGRNFSGLFGERGDLEFQASVEELTVIECTGGYIQTEPNFTTSFLGIKPTATFVSCMYNTWDLVGFDSDQDLQVFNLLNCANKDRGQGGEIWTRVARLNIQGGIFGITNRIDWRCSSSRVSNATLIIGVDAATNAFLPLYISSISNVSPYYQNHVFTNCNFVAQSTANGSTTGYAIFGSAAPTTSSYRVEFNNCTFSSAFQYTAECYRNGTFVFNECSLASRAGAFAIRAGSDSTYISDVTISNCDLTNVSGFLFTINAAGTTNWRLRFNGTMDYAKFTAMGRPATEYQDTKVIHNCIWMADSRPAAAGLNGQIVRLRKPTLGQAAEYVCSTGDITTATWRISQQAGTVRNTTASRPTPDANDIGLVYLDTTLDADGKPIWWNGTAWVDATGLVV